MRVSLFTTLGCHLCEEALVLLQAVAQARSAAEAEPLEIEAVEIADSDELMDRYGIRIPVVRTPDERELGWPFSLEALEGFLNG